MHKLMLYALSTCVWCRRAKQFLDQNNLVYDYVYVDKLEPSERQKVMVEVRRWNARESFPTLVIDDAKALVGFDEQEWREVLKT